MKLFDKIKGLFTKAEEEVEKVAEVIEKLPLSVSNDNGCLILSIRGIQVFEHSTTNPFATVYRGEYNLKETIKGLSYEIFNRKTIPLEKYEVKDIKGGKEIKFFDKGYTIIFTFKEEESGLSIKMSSKENFERLKLSFSKNSEEKLTGFGGNFNEKHSIYNVLPYNKNHIGLFAFLGAKQVINEENAVDNFPTFISSRGYLFRITGGGNVRFEFEKNNFSLNLNKNFDTIKYLIANDKSTVLTLMGKVFRQNQRFALKSAEKPFTLLKLKEAEKMEILSDYVIIDNFNIAMNELKLLQLKDKKVILKVMPFFSKTEEFPDSLLLMDDKNRLLTMKVDGKKLVALNLKNENAVSLLKNKLLQFYVDEAICGFMSTTNFVKGMDESYAVKFAEIVNEVALNKANGIHISCNASHAILKNAIYYSQITPKGNVKDAFEIIMNKIAGLTDSGVGMVSLGFDLSKLDSEALMQIAKVLAVMPIIITDKNCCKLLSKDSTFETVRSMLIAGVKTALQETLSGQPLLQKADDDSWFLGSCLNIACEQKKIEIKINQKGIWKSLKDLTKEEVKC